MIKQNETLKIITIYNNTDRNDMNTEKHNFYTFY